jgi:hypothetical protein
MAALVQEIFEIVSRITEQVNRSGGYLPAASKTPKRLEFVVDDAALKQTFSYLTTYLKVISDVTSNIEPQPIRTARQLDDFLNHHKLKLVDRNFLKSLRSTDLVEVYTLDHQQIFRNPQFFNITSYDLETLIFVPWQHLFWRHQSVQDLIIKVLDEVVKQKQGALEKPPIPQHLLRECFDGHDRAIHYKMEKVGCIVDEELDEAMGYITILNASKVKDGHNISIL